MAIEKASNIVSGISCVSKKTYVRRYVEISLALKVPKKSHKETERIQEKLENDFLVTWEKFVLFKVESGGR